MPWSVVETRSAVQNTAPTLTTDASVQADDVGVALLGVSSTSATIAEATGWTATTWTDTTQSTNQQAKTWYRKETAGSTAHAFDRGSAGRWAIAGIWIRGAASSPLGASNQVARSVAASHTTSSISCTAGSFLVAIFCTRVFPTSPTWSVSAASASDGWTEQIEDVGADGTTNMRVMIATREITSAGSYSCTADLTGSTEPALVAIVELLAPAGGGTPSGDASLAVTASFGTTSAADKPVASSLALTASVSASAVKAIPASASVAVVASVATTAVPSRIGAAALTITASVSTSATSAKPVDASLSITATVAATGAVGVLAALTITATVAASATPTRVGGASVSVVATLATSIVDSRTTTAGLALTVALVASATVGGAVPDIVGGSIGYGVVSVSVHAGNVATSPIGATTRGGVIHGV